MKIFLLSWKSESWLGIFSCRAFFLHMCERGKKITSKPSTTITCLNNFTKLNSKLLEEIFQVLLSCLILNCFVLFSLHYLTSFSCLQLCPKLFLNLIPCTLLDIDENYFKLMSSGEGCESFFAFIYTWYRNHCFLGTLFQPHERNFMTRHCKKSLKGKGNTFVAQEFKKYDSMHRINSFKEWFQFSKTEWNHSFLL